MNSTAAIKKDLQKIVKKFRDAKPDGKNWRGEPCRETSPKASLTGQQEAKRTATVNFGCNSEKHNAEYAAFVASRSFGEFCAKHGIKIGHKEINPDNCVQLRLYY